jgi:hypothetical protein
LQHGQQFPLCFAADWSRRTRRLEVVTKVNCAPEAVDELDAGRTVTNVLFHGLAGFRREFAVQVLGEPGKQVRTVAGWRRRFV